MNSHTLWAIGAIFAVLVVASSVVQLMRIKSPDKDYSELWLRIRSWWIMAAVFSVALAVNRNVSLAFFGLVSFLAFKEFLSMIETRRADRRALFWAYLTIPFQYYWVAKEWYGMFIIFIPVYAFLFLPMRMVIVGETKGFLRAAGTMHWGLMTTVFSISHVAYLLTLPQLEKSPAGGAGLVLFLVVLTQLNDVSQYISGKLMGRRKVIPKVSPNKTLEGLLGGLVATTTLAFLIAPWLTPFSRVESLAAGLLIGLGGFVGDVVISALKRDIGVKDSGSLLPGHGGILDRVDSLTYTAPLFFHFVYYLYY